MQVAQHHSGPGQQTPSEPLRRRINNWLAHTISRFRIVILVIVIAAAAFLIGYLIYSEVEKKVQADSAVQAELIQDSFEKWSSESDATKKAALEKDLVAKLDSAVSRYPRQYGGQRALFVRATVFYETKDWEKARADYEMLARRFSRSYLAPIALFNAAICNEEKGDKDSAQKLYVRVYTEYKDSTVAPRALFDAARLDEAKGAWDDAQKKYQSADTLFNQSVWNRLAKDRLVQLKILGKTK